MTPDPWNDPWTATSSRIVTGHGSLSSGVSHPILQRATRLEPGHDRPRCCPRMSKNPSPRAPIGRIARGGRCTRPGERMAGRSIKPSGTGCSRHWQPAQTTTLEVWATTLGPAGAIQALRSTSESDDSSQTASNVTFDRLAATMVAVGNPGHRELLRLRIQRRSIPDPTRSDDLAPRFLTLGPASHGQSRPEAVHLESPFIGAPRPRGARANRGVSAVATVAAVKRMRADPYPTRGHEDAHPARPGVVKG